MSRAGFRIVLEIERGAGVVVGSNIRCTQLVIGEDGIELSYSYLESILETNAVLLPIDVVD